MATAFQFVPETHTYLLAGRVVPSVTQILERAGLVCYDHIPKAILDHKAEVNAKDEIGETALWCAVGYGAASSAQMNPPLSATNPPIAHAPRINAGV